MRIWDANDTQSHMRIWSANDCRPQAKSFSMDVNCSLSCQSIDPCHVNLALPAPAAAGVMPRSHPVLISAFIMPRSLGDRSPSAHVYHLVLSLIGTRLKAQSYASRDWGPREQIYSLQHSLTECSQSQ